MFHNVSNRLHVVVERARKANDWAGQLVRYRCLDTISKAAVIHCDGQVIPAGGSVSRPAYFYYRACIAK